MDGCTLFVYVSSKDQAFAPNMATTSPDKAPVCTFATCCPGIRKLAQPGDLVLGTSSVQPRQGPSSRRIVWIGEVGEISDFGKFWNDPRFQHKKAIPLNMNPLPYQRFGDNIYVPQPDGTYKQDANTTKHNKPSLVRRDLRSYRVLIMKRFAYHGGKGAAFSPGLHNVRDSLLNKQRQYVAFNDIKAIRAAQHHLDLNSGVLGEPKLWKTKEYGAWDILTAKVGKDRTKSQPRAKSRSKSKKKIIKYRANTRTKTRTKIQIKK